MRAGDLSAGQVRDPLAAGPIFATVTINTVQTFELVGP